MVDPVSRAAMIPWRGKTYEMQFTLGALAQASGVPGVPPIVEGGPDSVWTKPPFFKYGVLLFALVRRKFTDTTLDECMDVICGDKAAYYIEQINLALEEVAPALAKLHGVEQDDARPTQGASTGDASGPALVSTSASKRKSSGSLRRDS